MPWSGWSQARRVPSGEMAGLVRSGLPKSTSRGMSGVSARAATATSRTARAKRRRGGLAMEAHVLAQERPLARWTSSWQGGVQRVRSEAFRWWPAWLLVAGGLLALGTRFVDRDIESYVLDEPQRQDVSARDAAAGHWASISALRGTRGLRYGPAPLWFYTAVHRVAGPRPEAGIVAAGLFLTGAACVLAWVLARRSQAPPLVLAVGLW